MQFDPTSCLPNPGALVRPQKFLPLAPAPNPVTPPPLSLCSSSKPYHAPCPASSHPEGFYFLSKDL